jgi:hypothetical protein
LREYYIVDDSYNGMGTPYNTSRIGQYTADGATYTLYKGTRVNAASIDGDGKTFPQVFAVRSGARTCGTISVSEHFENWQKNGVELGGVYDCKIVCEAGGGSGSIEYTYASMCWNGCKGKGSICAKSGSVSSVEDAEVEEDGIVLMPNPAENYFIVKSIKAIERIDLINIFGQTVYSKSNSNMVEFNLPAGTYVVKIATEDGAVSAKRLIVK